MLAVPLAALPVRACRGLASPARSLGPEVAAALLDAPWTVVRFGTPSAEPFEEDGLDIPLDRRGETWAFARKRVEIHLRIDPVGPRVALLDLEPGPGTTRVRVLLNGMPVGALPLEPGRRRLRVELPEDRQVPGVNTLGLVFGTPPEPPRGAGPRHAARLFGLVVGPPSAALEALAGGAPPFSSWEEKEGVVQAGPSTLRWASDWTGGTLHVSGALHEWSRAAHARARVSVSVEDAAGKHELWQSVVGPGDSPDALVPLPEAAGGLQQVSLAVEPVGAGPVWFNWREIDVAAEGKASPAPVDVAPLRSALARANVVLVVFDAAGARHFSSYGHAQRTTPEADRLAAEGVLFERAYTPAVFTISAMSSIWTSLPPDQHHRGVSHDDRLPDAVPTLAERLSQAGVHTAGFVANGMAGSGFGLDRGFAEFSYVGYEAGAFRPVLGPWLQKNARAGRFFLYVHVRQPHTPLDAPPPFDTAFGNQPPITAEQSDAWLRVVNDHEHTPTPAEVARLEQLYDGNLAVADRELGWLRRELEKAGVWDDTVLLLTGDHGEALHEHGFVGHNAQLYDESLHVPLILRLPPAAGVSGKRVAEVVDHLDLAPTVADVFGLRGPAVAGFHGRSLLEIALGARGRGASLARTAGPRPRYALTDATTRYIFDSRYGDEELYDLAADPGEQNDLAAVDGLRAAVYRQRLHGLLLKLPGRSSGPRSPWKMDPKQLEDLRALGYVN